MNFRNRLVPIFIPALILFTILGLRIVFSDRMEEFSLKVFDRFIQLRPRAYEDVPVRFLDIDDETLKRLGQWPWPRTLVAQLVDKLSESGAAVIAMDVIFAEPDRTSPAALLPLWPDSPEIASLKLKASALPDHDKILAASIANANVVTAFSLTREATADSPQLKAGFAYSGEDPVHFLNKFQGGITTLPILEKEASGNGGINFLAEKDGILRRIPLIFRLRDKLYPSLAAEALRVAQGATTYAVKSAGGSGETNFGERTGMVSLKVGNFIIPTDNNGRLYLYDAGPAANRKIPAWKVFEKDFDPKSVEGMILFVGSSAAGLKDLRATALNPVAAGTELHVQAVEQILQQKFLILPDWAEGAEILSLFMMGLTLIFLLPLVGATWCALISGLFFISGFVFSWQAFITRHWLLDPVTPAIAGLVIYLAVSLINFLRTESEKRFVRDAFSRYLSPALVEKLSSQPGTLKLGGETREMTILFSDIRGFTSLSEKYTAAELTHFMNRYLTPMTDVILKSQGTIDKYIGDCIMAFWNAPLDDSAHALHAAEASLGMRRALLRFNETFEQEALAQGKSFQRVRIGIGLNTGTCSVGNMGSDQRFDYSVLGDDVNLASRIESLSNSYGVDIVLGPKTYEAVYKNFAVLELDLIQVKGKTKPVTLHALAGDSSLKQNADFMRLEKLHSEMIDAYRNQEWVNAENLIAECLKINMQELDLKLLYMFYLKRIAAFKITPPEEGWHGVFIATSK